MREHDALWVTGRTRSEDHLGQVIARDRLGDDFAVDRQVHRFEDVRGDFEFAQDFRLGLAGERDGWLRLADHTLDEFSRRAHVERDHNRAVQVAAKHRGHPVRLVRGPNDDSVALADVLLAHELGVGVGSLIEFRVVVLDGAHTEAHGDGRPVRVLGSGPFKHVSKRVHFSGSVFANSRTRWSAPPRIGRK